MGHARHLHGLKMAIFSKNERINGAEIRRDATRSIQPPDRLDGSSVMFGPY